MAIRSVSVDRGRDPRDHVMVAFGGAGGLHAYQIARSVGIDRVLVPPFAGVACAFGATTMDVRHDLEATFYAPVDEADPAELIRAYAELEGKVRRLLEADGVPADEIELERSAMMRYVGQSYEVNTPVSGGALGHSDLEEIARAFNAEHEREYGVSSSDFAVAFVTLRVTGTGRGDRPTTEELASAIGRGVGDGDSIKQRRSTYFDGQHHEVDVHDVARLAADARIAGPAIIEQPDGVIVLPPGSVAVADRFHNVMITTGDEQKAA